MEPAQPHPWSTAELSAHRLEVLSAHVSADHPFYEEAGELLDPPLSHMEAHELLTRGLEVHAEIRALARDLKTLQLLLKGVKGRTRRSLKYQSWMGVKRGLTARLEHLESEAVERVPFTFSRADLHARFMPAGEGLTLDFLEPVPDRIVDEIFPPLLDGYNKSV